MTDNGTPRPRLDHPSPFAAGLRPLRCLRLPAGALAVERRREVPKFGRLVLTARDQPWGLECKRDCAHSLHVPLAHGDASEGGNRVGDGCRLPHTRGAVLGRGGNQLAVHMHVQTQHDVGVRREQRTRHAATGVKELDLLRVCGHREAHPTPAAAAALARRRHHRRGAAGAAGDSWRGNDAFDIGDLVIIPGKAAGGAQGRALVEDDIVVDCECEEGTVRAHCREARQAWPLAAPTALAAVCALFPHQAPTTSCVPDPQPPALTGTHKLERRRAACGGGARGRGWRAHHQPLERLEDGDGTLELPVAATPHAHELIAACRQHRQAVGREGEGGGLAHVRGERRLARLCVQVPYLDRVVRRGGDEEELPVRLHGVEGD